MTDLDLITLTAAVLGSGYGAGRLIDSEMQEAVEDAMKLRHEARRQLGEARGERFAEAHALDLLRRVSKAGAYADDPGCEGFIIPHALGMELQTWLEGEGYV